MKKALFVLIALAFAAQVSASTETVTKTPTHSSGINASAPIDPSLHQGNEGGSDGAGLCVIASVTTAGRHLGVNNVERLWDAAKKQPGGYHPEKFDRLASQVAPDLKYAHYVGSDYEALKRLSSEKLPFGVTMDTGDLYGGQPIHHMVTGVHFDDNLACYIDNNKPGWFAWVSQKEWMRRSTLNTGEFWVLALAPTSSKPAFGVWILLSSAGFWLWSSRKGRRLPRPCLTS